MRNIFYKFWAASISRQLMIGIALVHAVLMSIFVFDLVDREREFMIDQNNKSAIGLAHTLATNGSSWILANDVIGIEEVIQSQNSFPDLISAMFLDMNGKILGFTDRSKVGQFINDPLSLQLLKARPTEQFLVNNSKVIDIAVPVKTNDRQIGWARIRIDRSEITANLQIITNNGLIYIAIAISVGLFFAWFMARSMTKDLRTMEQKANQVFDGKKDVNFLLDRTDELGKLSTHFDKMVKKREDELSSTNHKLADSQERLQLALDATNEGLWDWNMKSNEVYFSPRWKSMLGYEPHELENTFKTWEDLLHPEDYERVYNEVMALVSGSTQYLESIYRLRHKDGSYRWILDRGKVISGIDGQATRMVGTHADITKRITAEIELQESKDQWMETFDSLTDIITIQNKEMRIVRANKAAYQFFDQNSDGLVGKSCFQVLCGKAEHCKDCPLSKTMTDNSSCTEIIHHEHIGKTFMVSSSSILDENGELQYLVHIAKDITEHEKQEQLILKMSLENQQLKHIESLQTMAGAIAHRFNNAMTAVRGNLELMSLSLNKDSDEYSMATDAANAAKGASRVGSLLLNYVGQQPLQLEKTAFSDLVRETTTSLQHYWKLPISLQFTPPDEPNLCMMDRSQLMEVIENILINAVESLEENGGTVDVSFGADYFTADSFPVSFQNDDLIDGRYIFCQIKDTGHGIAPEELPRIFEPFYTSRFVGRGLGLAMTIGIMRAHKSAITVESIPDGGTTVRIFLPTIESTS